MDDFCGTPEHFLFGTLEVVAVWMTTGRPAAGVKVCVETGSPSPGGPG